MLFWTRMRAARSWQHPMMNQYRCSLKTTSFLLWAHHRLDVYSMLLDFSCLFVCKTNNTFIVLFRQNAFDLLVVLGRVLAGGLNLLSSHGSGNSQVRPDISHSSASGAAGVTGFQGEFAWVLLEPSEKGFLIWRQHMLKDKQKKDSTICFLRCSSKEKQFWDIFVVTWEENRENPTGNNIQENYRESFCST